MRAAVFIATCFLTATAVAQTQTIYCCTLNDNDQVVPEDDETSVCCQSSGGSMQGHECVMEAGLFGFNQCCRQQTTNSCNF